LYVPCANRDSLACFFFFTLFCSGKYSGENPQAASSATGTMVYLGGEQLATGGSATAPRASQLLVAAAALTAVALLDLSLPTYVAV
jgi:hypothetical protein